MPGRYSHHSCLHLCLFLGTFFFFLLLLSKSHTSPVRSWFQGATNESLKKSLVRQLPRQLFCTSKRPAYFSSCCQMEAASPSPHNGTDGTAPSLRLFFFSSSCSRLQTLCIFLSSLALFFGGRFLLHLHRRTSSLSPLIYQLPPLVSASSSSAIRSQDQDPPP